MKLYIVRRAFRIYISLHNFFVLSQSGACFPNENYKKFYANLQESPFVLENIFIFYLKQNLLISIREKRKKKKTRRRSRTMKTFPFQTINQDKNGIQHKKRSFHVSFMYFIYVRSSNILYKNIFPM